MPEGVSAVIRGNQASSGLQPTPDSGMAVLDGNRKPSRLQLTPDNGTIIIRGNQAPSTPPDNARRVSDHDK
jgi:hypothetical protein